MSSKNRHIWFTMFALALLFMAGNFVGCETEDWTGTVNCDDCFGFQPDSAKLIVYVSISMEQDSVPLTFYRGDSKGEVDWQDTATTNEFYLDAEVGAVYTVEAQYRSGPTSIIAYDSDKMTLSYHGDDCGYTCYIVKGGIFDVRLAGN
jgi:hypothetical protein